MAGQVFDDDDNVLMFLVIPFMEKIKEDPSSQPSVLTLFVTSSDKFASSEFSKLVFFENKGEIRGHVEVLTKR